MTPRKSSVIIFLGPPGAGKGTQAKMVAKKLDLPHISTGDILRNAINNGSDLGKEAQQFMDKGELVPDNIIFAITEERLQQPDCTHGAIFDGFPRNIAQAKEFMNLDYINKADESFAILIDLANDKVIERISNRRSCPNCNSVYNLINKKPKKKVDGHYICDNCGSELVIREDDKVETIKNRLSVYEKSTAPIINFFKNESILNTVDGAQSVEKINSEIMHILDK